MKNIELKIRVRDFKKIVPVLRKIKSRYLGALHQVDIYYHCRHGRMKIREINNKQFELIYYNPSRYYGP